jgi:hypothetical protein
MEKEERFTQRLFRTSVTLDKSTVKLAMELKKHHQSKSMSDYVKGLIALDALQSKKGPLDLQAVPTWIILAYGLDVTKGMVQPPSKSLPK